MPPSVQYADLSALLSRLGYTDDAAAYHGALCGALCRAAPEEIEPESLLEDDCAPPDAAGRAELAQLLEQTVEELCDAELGFMPLLPEDDVALAERAQALAAWCEGFLYGLAGRLRLDLAACSEEVREVVRDFTQFTRAALGTGDDSEVEESAYAELVEYVRVGAQLVYMELRPRGGGSDAEGHPTIH